ncbi:MAG: cytochrome c peroxidase [Saprospiraceae bacterium]
MTPKTFYPRLLLCLCLSGLLFSCGEDRIELTKSEYTAEEYAVLSKTLNLPLEGINFKVKLPAHLINRTKIPLIHNQKATLGAVLFYDTKLSANNSISCASCHKQSIAFSDDVSFSKGFYGELTKRNSLALASAINVEMSYNMSKAFDGKERSAFFFWDERANSIEEQIKMTLQDKIEMGINLEELPEKLGKEDYYKILFTKAYGTDEVSMDRITESIEMFIKSFTVGNSRFDEGMNQSRQPFYDFTNFSSQENWGKTLFNTNCTNCHSADFSALVETMANNGLDLDYADNGLGGLYNIDYNNGRFKVPFLRNIVLTGPYMHDGRFASLEEVIDHYSEGIQAHPNLDSRLRKDLDPNGEPVRMNFTAEEKAALVAFLNTLTDYDFIQDARFSDPFKK